MKGVSLLVLCKWALANWRACVVWWCKSLWFWLFVTMWEWRPSVARFFPFFFLKKFWLFFFKSTVLLSSLGDLILCMQKMLPGLTQQYSLLASLFLEFAMACRYVCEFALRVDLILCLWLLLEFSVFRVFGIFSYMR